MASYREPAESRGFPVRTSPRSSSRHTRVRLESCLLWSGSRLPVPRVQAYGGGSAPRSLDDRRIDCLSAAVAAGVFRYEDRINHERLLNWRYRAAEYGEVPQDDYEEDVQDDYADEQATEETVGDQCLRDRAKAQGDEAP
jgi:hypothetical protein